MFALLCTLILRFPPAQKCFRKVFSFAVNHRLESQRCCDPGTSHKSWPHACAVDTLVTRVCPYVLMWWRCGLGVLSLPSDFRAGLGKREFTSVSWEAECFVVVAWRGRMVALPWVIPPE